MQFVLDRRKQKNLIYSCHKQFFHLKRKKHIRLYVRNKSNIKFFSYSYDEIDKYIDRIFRKACEQMDLFESNKELYSLFEKYRRNLKRCILNLKGNEKNHKMPRQLPVMLMNSHSKLFRYLKDNKVKYRIKSEDIVGLINPCLVITNGKF